MKRIWIVVASLFAVLVLGTGLLLAKIFYFAPNTNKENLDAMMQRFGQVLTQHGLEPIETESAYGKLMGDVTGVQYFGAALLEKDQLDEQKAEALLKDIRAELQIAACRNQKDGAIRSEYLENVFLKYDTALTEGTEYVTVFFFVPSHADSDLWDPAAH